MLLSLPGEDGQEALGGGHKDGHSPARPDTDSPVLEAATEHGLDIGSEGFLVDCHRYSLKYAQEVEIAQGFQP